MELQLLIANLKKFARIDSLKERTDMAHQILDDFTYMWDEGDELDEIKQTLRADFLNDDGKKIISDEIIEMMIKNNLPRD